MIEIPLTKGYVAIVDNEDADLAELEWYAIESKHQVYAVRNCHIEKGRRIKQLMHHVILARVLNRELPQSEMIDHINVNALDNTRNNLRLCTYKQNAGNTRPMPSNTSGFKGVTATPFATDSTINKWKAQIKINRRTRYLGSFPTKEQAFEAYCKAAQEHFGEFWRAS